MERRKINKLWFRHVRTPSYIFGSCFAGFVIEFDNGEILTQDLRQYLSHPNTFLELDMYNSTIIGSRGSWSRGKHYSIEAF